MKLVKSETADLTKWEIEDITKIVDATGLYNLQKEIEAV